MPYSLRRNQNVMIDLETLALHENAVVFSIGAIIYDGEWNEEAVFSVNLDIEEQKTKYARDVNPSTLAWWNKQDPTIFDKCTQNAVSLQTGVGLMVDFFYDNLKDPTKTFYWGNSAIFDLLKINSLLKNNKDTNYSKLLVADFSIDEYWMRCYKTTRDVFRDYFKLKNLHRNVTHYPIDDARTQGSYMKQIFDLSVDIARKKPTVYESFPNATKPVDKYQSLAQNVISEVKEKVNRVL